MVLLSSHQFSIHLLPFGWSWSHHHHCYANSLYRSFFTTQKRNRQQHNRSNIHNISLQYKSLGKRMYVIDDSIWCPTFDSYSRKSLNPLLRDFFQKRKLQYKGRIKCWAIWKFYLIRIIIFILHILIYCARTNLMYF